MATEESLKRQGLWDYYRDAPLRRNMPVPDETLDNSKPDTRSSNPSIKLSNDLSDRFIVIECRDAATKRVVAGKIKRAFESTPVEMVPQPGLRVSNDRLLALISFAERSDTRAIGLGPTLDDIGLALKELSNRRAFETPVSQLDWLNDRGFYEIMYVYRTAPSHYPAVVVDAFESVKVFIRAKISTAEKTAVTPEQKAQGMREFIQANWEKEKTPVTLAACSECHAENTIGHLLASGKCTACELL